MTPREQTPATQGDGEGRRVFLGTACAGSPAQKLRAMGSIISESRPRGRNKKVYLRDQEVYRRRNGL